LTWFIRYHWWPYSSPVFGIHYRWLFWWYVVICWSWPDDIPMPIVLIHFVVLLMIFLTLLFSIDIQWWYYWRIIHYSDPIRYCWYIDIVVHLHLMMTVIFIVDMMMTDHVFSIPDKLFDYDDPLLTYSYGTSRLFYLILLLMLFLMTTIFWHWPFVVIRNSLFLTVVIVGIDIRAVDIGIDTITDVPVQWWPYSWFRYSVLLMIDGIIPTIVGIDIVTDVTLTSYRWPHLIFYIVFGDVFGIQYWFGILFVNGRPKPILFGIDVMMTLTYEWYSIFDIHSSMIFIRIYSMIHCASVLY